MTTTIATTMPIRIITATITTRIPITAILMAIPNDFNCKGTTDVSL